MQRLFSTYGAYAMMVVALLALGGVWYSASSLTRATSEALALSARVQEASIKQAAAVRQQALIANTAATRAELASLLNVDVLRVADLIEAAGRSASVETRVSDALPESVPESAQALHAEALGFIVESRGSFTALIRALGLFETLPLVSSVTQFDIQREGGESSLWHMSAHIRVLASDTTP